MADLEKVTYRDQLQATIREIWGSYDKVGSLRDSAASEDKEPYNKARGFLHDAAIALVNHDNALPPEKAGRIL